MRLILKLETSENQHGELHILFIIIIIIFTPTFKRRKILTPRQLMTSHGVAAREGPRLGLMR